MSTEAMKAAQGMIVPPGGQNGDRKPLAYSKSLKALPIPVAIHLRHPETDEPIEVRFRMRRMRDADINSLTRKQAEREAKGEEMGTADIIETMAPLVMEVGGITDFPTPDAGTWAERFMAYFGGDGTETAEDMEVENKIVQALWMEYAPRCFRLVPFELVSSVSLPGGSDGPPSEVPGDGSGTDV